MLKLAIEYKEELEKKFLEIAYDDRYKYYQGRYIDLSDKLFSNTWKAIQYVSINKKKRVLGFFQVSVDRTMHSVSNLHAVKFTKSKNEVFTEDFKIFTDSLFTKHKFNKVVNTLFHRLKY